MDTEHGKNAERFLDIGHGLEARHLQRLQQEGKNVFGFDFVKNHPELAKGVYPKLQAVAADWHRVPFNNASFDFAYCLGRSFLHNTTVADARSLLRELIKESAKKRWCYNDRYLQSQ